MPEKSNSQLNNLDDKLAEFADQVLDGQVSSIASLDDEDEEMHSLAQMVTRLDGEFGSDQPSSEMAERIKARLIVEWQKATPGAQTATSRRRWWQKLTQGRASSYRQQQVFTFALATMVVIVLVVVALSPLSTGTSLPGTAEIGGGVIFVALLTGGILLGIIAWFLRRKL